MPQLFIGWLAERTGVNIETIRYYERVGLLSTPQRTENRRRMYDERDVQKLTFVRRSRELGFSLKDIRTLIDIAEHSNLACAEVKEMSLRRLFDVRGKIATLKKLERALKSMTDACAPGTMEPCPVFEALAQS